MCSTGVHTRPIAVIVADFNGDNQSDIAVANSNTSSVGVFIGYSNGSLTNIVEYFTGGDSHPSSITANDFNNDNQLDMAVTDSVGNKLFILRSYGNGTFVQDSVIEFGFQARPSCVVHGTFNKDENMDLAVANHDQGNIAIILKEC
ncbi:unnamed protein product [Rotaria sp. Silwood1]|nr:unnamed protein product [Rotaria sp. Silwood1]CAF1656321.1 unnamed protein product [Rotaria sp. Silwood1]CAF3765651.1 unnamed protein product [Rotaria sp. Silwood1]CAF3784690.1 unnamed protein product [Rotaria sp. Silwood1]CAF3835221.1 unnamed protein product [Rotaria sp. Silwood1]